MSIVDNNDHEVIDGPILFNVTEVMKDAGIEEFYLEGNDFVMKFKEGGVRCFPFKAKNSSVSEIVTKIQQKLKHEPAYDSLKPSIKDIESQLIERRDEIFENHEQSRPVHIQTNYEITLKIIERITTTREFVIENNLNYDGWLAGLEKKYLNLKALVSGLLPELWLPLEFVVSVKMILKIKGWTLPFMAVLLAVPSSMKTVTLDMLIDYPDTYTTDEFTPSSFVSHNSGKSEEELQKIDMLPRLVNKVCVFPELAPLFTSKDEDLQRNFGKILRILDGKGFQSDSGAHGHRGYSSDMMFVILGAAVEIPYRVYKLFGNLGQKIYYLRLPRINKTKEERKEAAKQKNDFKEKVSKIKEALFDYLIWLDSAPGPVAKLDKNGLLKFEWDVKKENEPEQDTALGHIVVIGELLAHLRGVVNTYESSVNRKYNKNTEGSQNGNDTTNPGLESLPTYSDFEHDFSIIEDSSRAITHLKSLAMGHAISRGRNYITLDDIPVVIKVALSSASIGRVRIFDLLLEQNGELTTSDICRELKVSPQTAHRTMTELHALEIVDMSAVGTYSNAELKIKLRDEFRWFLTPEFEKLREGFKPADYTKLKYKINVTESNIEDNAQNGKNKIERDNDDAYFRHTNEENLSPNRAKNNFNQQDVKGDKPNRNERPQNLDDKIITDNKLNQLQSTTISSEACHITTNGREQQALSDKSIDSDENNFNVPKGGQENCKPVTVTRLHEGTNGSANSYEHQLTVNQILEVIKEESLMSFNDAVKLACSRNGSIKSYLGDKLTSRENRKVRNIAVEIIRHTNVEVIKHKPQLVLKWIESSKSEFQSGVTA